MAPPAFRHRILIEPAPGCVTAEIEDDWHRMVVIVFHGGGIARTGEWPCQLSRVVRRTLKACKGNL